MAKKSIGKLILVVILGAMVGSLLGHLIGLVLPEGVVKQFFLTSANLEVGPGSISTWLFGVTFGFNLKMNVIGLIGIGIAVYYLRWY